MEPLFGYEKKLDARFIPNGLGPGSPFFERFANASGEYAVEYCRSPLLNLFAEFGKKFEEDLIENLSRSGVQYLYLIEMLYSFPVWLPRPQRPESKLNPWQFISGDALERIRSGQAVLVVTHLKKVERDPYAIQMFGRLHMKLRELGIPPRNVVFIGCNNDTVSHYRRALETLSIQEPLRAVCGVPYFEWGWDTYYRKYLEKGQVFTLAEARAEIDRPKPYRYLCFNREPRAHRLLNALWLFSRGLLEKGLVSFPKEDENFKFNKFDQYGEGVAQIFRDPEIHALLQHVPSFAERHLPLHVDHDNLFLLHISWCTKDPFRNSYFSLLTERLYHNPNGQMLLTSKAFKAICNMHPFILLGPKGALAALRAAGYRTFSPWIDESYDEESDPDLRIRKVWSEVERLCRMSDDEIHRWYRSIFPILEFNNEQYHARNRSEQVDQLIRVLRSDPAASTSFLDLHNT